MALLGSWISNQSCNDRSVLNVDDWGQVEFTDEDARLNFQQLCMDIVELHYRLQAEHERVVTNLTREKQIILKQHLSLEEKMQGAIDEVKCHPCPRTDPEKRIKHPLPPSPPPALRDADDELSADDDGNTITAKRLGSRVKLFDSDHDSILTASVTDTSGKEVKFMDVPSLPLHHGRGDNGNSFSTRKSNSSAGDSSSGEYDNTPDFNGHFSMERTAGVKVGRLAAFQQSDAILEGSTDTEMDTPPIRDTTYTTVSKKSRQSTRQSTISAPADNPANRRGAVWIRNSTQLEDDRRRLAAIAVGQEDDDDDELEDNEAQGDLKLRIQSLVRSIQFEMFFAAVIISNSIFMGVQTEYTVAFPHDDPPLGFYALQFLYGAIFSAELVLRIAVEPSLSFLCGSQWHWNMLDIFIVVTSLFEMFTDIIYLTSKSSSSDAIGGISNLRIIRIIRITRLIRVFRVARIVRFIRALRTLVYSILCTLKSVVWAILLLFIIVYVTGMVFAQAASDYLSAGNTEDAVLIHKFWGSLPRAMFTLYKSVSGGLSWHDAVQPLSSIHGFWVGVFLAFVSFTFFAVLNVITGVFCQSAIESAQHDQEMQVQAVLQNKTMYIKKIQGLFQDIDQDASDYITFTEFERHFKEDKVRAYFASLEIDPADAWELFKLLDTNETGVIDTREFVMGCMRLRGQAKAIHIAQLSNENNAIRKKLTSHIEHVEAQLHYLIQTLNEEEKRSQLTAMKSETGKSDVTNLTGPGQSLYDFQMSRRSVAGKSSFGPAAQVFRQH